MNTSSPGETIVYGLDHHGSLRAVQGYLRLAGWIAGESIQSAEVRLRLDEGSVFDCQVGLARPDVATAHPALRGAAASGFALEVYLPPGLAIATLEFRSPAFPGWTAFHSCSVMAELGPVHVTLESAIPTTTEDSTLYLCGWCFHPQVEIDTLQVRFGCHLSQLGYGRSRTDAGELVPWNKQALKSGFEGHVKLGPGRASLVLIATLRNGAVLERVLAEELIIPDRPLELASQRANEARAELIQLPYAPSPSVSIVIPIFNQCELTLACLESLVAHAGRLSFEVIVIDDCSTADVSVALGKVACLRLLRNASNQGFVLNCNRGAAEANGEYIVFLNNDTVVTSGWLEALEDVFTSKSDAGLVGAKLLFPDGRLQEAGNLVWSDGTAWNYGRGEDPGQPEFNYLRRVDYCSGACVMIRRELFRLVGGFDSLYCPAYYEDVDLAFKVRHAGLQVYYQPASEIIHFEGMSSGKSTASGVKRHQIANQKKFLAKWSETLSRHGDGAHLAGLARDRYYRDRILVIDACALTPDMDAGSVRMFNLLKILAGDGFKVTFAAENLQFHEPFSGELRRAGVEHLGVPHTYSLESYLEQNGFSFEIVLLSRKAVAAKFLPLVRRVAPQAKVIFDTVDLMFLRLARQAKLEDSPELQLQSTASREEELALARAADLTYVVSDDEAAILAREVPSDKLAIVPLINPTRRSGIKYSDRWGILFVGGFQHPPNLDGILFFLEEVLPFVRAKIPELEVHIVGSRTPPALLARQEKHVQIHGFVPDLDSLLDRVRLSIAPLRFGAGVKGKINQSMACGVPVVATQIAVEGMHLATEVNCLVADDPQGFAAQVCRLHSDPELWARLSEASIAHVDTFFSFARVRTQLFDSFARIGAVGRRAPLELPVREVVDLPVDTRVPCTPDSTAPLYLGAGWNRLDESHSWSIAPRATIRFKVPAMASTYRFKAELFPLLVDTRIVQQRVEIAAVGMDDATSWLLDQPGVTAREFTFTVQQRNQGIVELEFRFPDAAKPVQLGLSADERSLAIGLVSFALSRD